MADTALVHLSKISKALQQAKTFEDYRDVRVMAKIGLQAMKANRDARAEDRNELAEYVLRAERAMGLILKETAENGDRRAHGDNNIKLSNVGGDTVSPPTLEEIGVTKKQSSRWQAEASIPDEQFEQVIQETKESGEELTQGLMLRVAQEQKREDKREEVKQAVSLPAGKY